MRRPSWLRLPAPAVLTAEPLTVAPSLVGRPLGSPVRRAAAMAVDLVLVALLATAGGYWLAAALLLLAWQLRGALAREGVDAAVVALLAVAVAAAAAYAAWGEWQRGTDATRQAATAARAPAAAPAPSHLGRNSRDPVAVAAGPAGEAERSARLQAEIERLRAQLDQRPDWRRTVDAWLDGLGLRFGWAIAYFSLLPGWAQGQTVGKKLLRLRVVEIATGRPTTLLTAFKRYGGYAAGMATGGMGFLQLLWEPNRQALHDKAAHTVVVRA